MTEKKKSTQLTDTQDGSPQSDSLSLMELYKKGKLSEGRWDDDIAWGINILNEYKKSKGR